MKKTLASKLSKSPQQLSLRSQIIRNRLLGGVAITALIVTMGMLIAKPAHTSTSAPVPVQVTNPSIATTSADEPGKQPFAKRLDLTFSGGSGSASFTVPTGKRLVITYVSTDAGVAPGASALLDLATTANGLEVESHLPLISQGTILGQSTFCSSNPMTVYADSASTVTLAALDSDSGSGGMIIGVYGYLVNA